MSEEEDDPIYMYTMVRTDLDSMNAGKGMAQASHATSHLILRAMRENSAKPPSILFGMIQIWEKSGNEDAVREAHHAIRDARDAGKPVEADIASKMIEDATYRGFGVEVTLEAKTYATLLTAIGIANEMGVCCALIRDPTYPLRDGAVTHFIPLETCGYLFGRRSKCQEVFAATRKAVSDDTELNWHP